MGRSSDGTQVFKGRGLRAPGGRRLQMLRDAGARAVGVDYAASALSDVRRRQPAARLLRGDATCLPLQDASIDLVVSFETIEHVPDAAALVVEIRRVLKPGGRLVLSTPNRAFGPPARHTDNPFHIREFTADELRDLLRASFEQVQLYGQRPSEAYRYVPFLMLEPHNEPSALAWKLLVRLPFGLKNRLALALSGRSVLSGRGRLPFRGRRVRWRPRAGGGRTVTPLFSAIIPTYNQAAFLRRAIDSALTQRLPVEGAVEVIVVDDESTDATPQVAAEFGARIRYMRQANRREGAARNTGAAPRHGYVLRVPRFRRLLAARQVGRRPGPLRASRPPGAGLFARSQR